MHAAYIAVAASFLTACAAGAQEKVEDPYFKNWSKFPKGTQVVYKQTTRNLPGQPGMQLFEYTATFTLVELTDDKVVIESAGEYFLNGKPRGKSEPSKADIPKTKTLAKGEHLFASIFPSDKPTEAEEKLTVLGKEMKTRRYDTKRDAYEGSIWVSEEVPGLKVKSWFISRDAGGVLLQETTLELVEVKKP